MDVGHLRLTYSPLGDANVQRIAKVEAVSPDGVAFELLATDTAIKAAPTGPAHVELSTFRFEVVTP